MSLIIQSHIFQYGHYVLGALHREPNKKTEAIMTSTKKKRMVGLAVALSAIFVVALISAVACGGFHHRHGDIEMAKKMIKSHVDDVLDDINADSSQRADIMALTDDILAELQKMKSAHNEGKALVLAELKKGEPNSETLHAMLDDRFGEIEDFAHKTLDKALAAYSTLRSDQREILLDKVSEHFEKREQSQRR
jgi:hypothetical protein